MRTIALRSSAPGFDRPLIFLHLPKTAGTTVSFVVRRHIDSTRDHLLRSVDGPDGLAKFKATPEAFRHRIHLLRGHQVFGLHEYLAPGARYLTVLRDPVARLVSHYRYVKATKHPMFIDAIRSEQMSLYNYVTSGLSGELENGQTRWLAGIHDDRPLVGSDLQLAIKNIDEHFAWVGIQERLEESLVELGLAMRWLRVDYRSRNVSGGQPSPPDAAVIAAIRDRNALDLELHQQMEARLDARGRIATTGRRGAATVLQAISGRRRTP